MAEIDIKSLVIGALIAIIITLTFLLNGDFSNKNGRYQFSPINRGLIIDTQTGSVKIIQYGVPFKDLKPSKK